MIPQKTMCSLGKTISSIISLVVVVVIVYICWEDIVPICKKLYYKMQTMYINHGVRQ